jgi:redox-sensing transcriptional repressor
MITNKNCIIRLSRYKNALYRLRQLGFVKVFSDNLADAIGVLPSQVRKDFSIFGISGNRRGGYQIDALIEKINTILGKERIQKVIVVGAGNIGTALLKYKGFEKEGIKIVACFEIDPSKFNKDTDIPVYPIEEMGAFVKKEVVKIGVIAVPDIAAQAALDLMTSVGIKGILNFAPIRLRASQEVVVNNVNLGVELENVIYFVNAVEKTSA